MKKLLFFILVALIVGASTSCDSGKKTTSKAEESSSTTTSKDSNSVTKAIDDSLLNELGELIGLQLRQMLIDSTSLDDIDMKVFMKGVEMGLDTIPNNRDKDYIMGLTFALQISSGITQFDNQGMSIDRKQLLKEIEKNVYRKGAVDVSELQAKQKKLTETMERASKVYGEKNEKEGKKYIEEQTKKDKDFIVTKSGIAYKVLEPGEGKNFSSSATVDIIYVGKHINGKEFDSSKGRSVPFKIDKTVPGFREMVTLMKPGEKVLVIIPGHLAYGDQGNPQGGIGFNETLIFELTTVGVHKK